jgi:hypothetical protein
MAEVMSGLSPSTLKGRTAFRPYDAANFVLKIALIFALQTTCLGFQGLFGGLPQFI